jgi:hypothetical protein
VTLNYNDGAASQTSVRAIQGTGANLALLTVSDGPTFNYGTIAIATTLDKTFTISNAGAGSASAISAVPLSPPFTFKGGSYPGTGGTCVSSIAPSASCTIVVTFGPSTTGSYSGAITINYNDTLNSQSANRPIQGTGM